MEWALNFAYVSNTTRRTIRLCDIAKSIIVHREMKLFNVYFLVWLWLDQFVPPSPPTYKITSFSLSTSRNRFCQPYLFGLKDDANESLVLRFPNLYQLLWTHSISLWSLNVVKGKVGGTPRLKLYEKVMNGTKKSLIFFLTWISDHDECMSSHHGCQHRCNNFHGSFFCSCFSGYAINRDNKTCSGMRLNCAC